MVERKRFLLWATGCSVYASFMIGYLLVLTLLLPSCQSMNPEWVKVGSYAQYAVRRYSYGSTVENGTYGWMIISTRTLASDEIVATINETYTLEWKADQWNSSWMNNIPPTGRISDVNLKDGFWFWFHRYYNDYLIDLTDFREGNDTFEGLGQEEVSIHDMTRPSVELTLSNPSYYRTDFYWFDRETGLLLQYIHYVFRSPQSSIMILENTNTTSGAIANNKATVDLLLISPLFVVPSVGAATGLRLIKLRRRQFSLQFWLCFVLFNGITLAFVANFPFRAPLTRLYLGFFSAYGPGVLLMLFMLNALFWFGVLAAAIFLIDRFAFPVIQRKTEKLILWTFSNLMS